MANENQAQRDGDYEPRVRNGTYRDRRDPGGPYRGEGAWRYDNPHYAGNPGPHNNPYPQGYYGKAYGPYHPNGYGGNPGRYEEYERPYFGRAGGYAGHVDVDPELFRHLVEVVRQLDGYYTKGYEGNPRTRRYVINMK